APPRRGRSPHRPSRSGPSAARLGDPVRGRRAPDVRPPPLPAQPLQGSRRAAVAGRRRDRRTTTSGLHTEGRLPRPLISVEWERNGTETQTTEGFFYRRLRDQETSYCLGTGDWGLIPNPQPLIPALGYHSNFIPKRASRGDTMVTGSRNVDPELHVMFAPGFAF